MTALWSAGLVCSDNVDYFVLLLMVTGAAMGKLEKLRVPEFELERIRALYNDPDKPLSVGRMRSVTVTKKALPDLQPKKAPPKKKKALPVVPAVIRPPVAVLPLVQPMQSVRITDKLDRIYTLGPRPGCERPFCVVIVLRISQSSGTLAEYQQLYAIAKEFAVRVRNAFGGEDLRSVHSYVHMQHSNHGEFSGELDEFITTCGAEGIAVRFLLIGFDAMCAAELLAVQMDLWSQKAAIELMVFQHTITKTLQTHPCSTRPHMTFGDWP